jgi:PKD repeat protein
MKKGTIAESGLFRPRIVIAVVFFYMGALLGIFSFAASPSSGTISLATPMLTYDGSGPYVVPNPSAQATGVPVCAPNPGGGLCDEFALTINVPIGTSATKQVKIAVGWPLSTADFDVYVLQGPTGETVATSCASSSDPEVCVVPAEPGVFRIRTVPFAPAGQNYTATVTLEDLPPQPPPPGTVGPRYQNYAPNPSNLPGADSAGEPSIGVDWNPNVAGLQHDSVNTGGVAFFTANLNEFRVSFDDCSSPAKNPNPPGGSFSNAPLWEDVTSPTEGLTSLDPIGFVDHQVPGEAGIGLGRIFQSQLAGATSIMAYSDTDGNSWIQSQGSGQPAGADHQTVGGGPYNNAAVPPPPPHLLYSHQVYYASQDIGTALAARSDDGGQTFGPGVPMWNISQCGGLHGHIKVGPDGTVYVPNRGCGGGQGVAVSRDNGLTWTVKIVPGSIPGDTDPSVGIGSDNTLYFGYANGNGAPHVATSTDHGDTWVDREVSNGLIKNTVFAHVVGGDGDQNGPNTGRAAFGFLGTTTPGNYQDTANFPGVWHFYIATTFNRGDQWVLVRATGNDPVQIGSICTAGTTCGADRNLLDFNDLQIDKEGRPLAAYADGCVAPDCTAETATSHGPPYNESRSALASILRQSGGPRLFSAFDSQANCTGSPPICVATAPRPPRVDSVTGSAGGTVHLDWSEPDNGGAPLTGYRVYRKDTVNNTYAILATITLGCPACKTDYDDTTTVAGTTYFYKVTALNTVGEGTNCGEFPIGTVTGAESACVLPGLTILQDPSGDILTPIGQTTNPGWDLRKLSVAEPFAFAPDKLVFTLKVEPFAGGVPPATTRWPIQFLVNGGTTTGYWVDMSTYPTDGGSSAAPVFKYGTFNPTGGTGGVYGAPNTRLGNAEPTSAFNPDGTITIVVPRSAVGNPAVGGGLSGFLVRVRFGTDASAVTPDNMPDSLAPSGNYTVVGNASCAPNDPPVAALSASPLSGNAPLQVNFNASASSDPDPGDTIVSYTFNFGEGSPPITQSTPTIQHTYNTAGNFQATVRVTDSRGKASSNVAAVVIDVNSPTGSPTPTPTVAPTATPTITATPTATATVAVTATPTATATVTPTVAPTATATVAPTATATVAPTATATVAPTATATVAPTATATVAPTATATVAPTTTPTATPTLTPTPTPAPPAQTINLSTRMRVQTGDSVGIGGFIITGTVPKHVLLRAIGPSLAGVPNPLADPVMELHGPDGFVTITNDNWRSDQEAAIIATGIPPTNDLEAAIDATLSPGAYSAVVSGKNNSSGVGLVEVYDLSQSVPAKLANISTRAFVATGDNVVIAGFILGNNPGDDRIVTRGIGPSLAAAGVPNVLADPTLELRDNNGALVFSNNDWQDDQGQAAELIAAGLAPTNPMESGIVATLPPGLYTALLAGLNNGSGIGLVEVYDLGGP